MVIVLVCTVAATIAVIAVQLGMFRVTSEVRLTGVESAKSSANVIRDTIRASLEQDPTGVYSYVLDDELPRICIPTGTIVNPGSVWPAECGPVWQYASAIVGSTSGAMITPPEPGNPALTVTAFARTGEITVGTVDTYQVGDLRRPRLYTGGTVNVTDLGALTLDAPVYSFDDLIFGTAQVTHGGLAAAENRLLGSLAVVDDGTGGTFAADTYDAGPPIVYSIRGAYPQPMPPTLLRSSLTALHALACPGVDPFGVNTVTSSLCLTPGGRVREIGGSLVTIPLNTTAVLLIPGATGDAVLYTTSADLATSAGSTCSDNCNLTALPADNTSAGTSAFWGSPLAEVRLPGTGLVGATVDVMVGLCGNPYATGGPCVSRGAPGQSKFPRTFTVVAGTLSDPTDIYIGGPINADDGRIGLVAAGDVVIPYFATSAGADLPVSAQIGALSESSSTALRSFPDTTATPASSRGTLQLNGILLLPDPSVSTPVFTQRDISFAADTTTSPPWFPTPALQWDRISSAAMTPAEALAAFDGTP